MDTTIGSADAFIFLTPEYNHSLPAVLKNVTQVLAVAGFSTMFFLLTLYMQDVLGYSAIRRGRSQSPRKHSHAARKLRNRAELANPGRLRTIRR